MSAILIRPLIENEGTQAEFARKIGATPALVWQWVEGRRPVSPRFAREIEAIYGVSRHDLRPDIFGPAPSTEVSDAA